MRLTSVVWSLTRPLISVAVVGTFLVLVVLQDLEGATVVGPWAGYVIKGWFEDHRERDDG